MEEVICGVLKSYEERFVVMGYLRVLGVPDPGVNLRKFRNKRKPRSLGVEGLLGFFGGEEWWLS
jgi:hypothetical protein